MDSSTTLEHQHMVLFLSNMLNTFVQFFRLGEVVVAPFDVRLWPGGPIREPDIVFISRGNLVNLTDDCYLGGPDLVIEIVSPYSASEDRVRKFQHYEDAGVREYWLIDPRPHQQQADFYVMGADGLFQAMPLGEGGCFH
ncbi:MAG: Uma2 family endonuclease, partial [Chloroflexota bacterium]